MSDNSQGDFDQWSKEQLDVAVNELINSNVFEKVRIEARVVWGIKDQVILAQVRETSVDLGFRWLIAGNSVPTDHIESSLAELPRDAARHFSLKWQLGAENVRNLPHDARKAMLHLDLGEMSKQLIRQAEALQELVSDESLW